MKKFGVSALTFVLAIGFAGFAVAGSFGPKGIQWHKGASVGVEDLLKSDFFGAYSMLDDMDFAGRYDYTAIAHESGHTNLVRDGIPWSEGGTMTTTFTTADYDNWGEWETVDFDAGEDLKFRDQSDGRPNVMLDPFDSTKWAGNYLKLFKLEENSDPLIWLDGNPILTAGTIIVGWNDNHLRKDQGFIDSDFDDLVVAMKPVPEPGTLLLLGLGLAGLAGVRRKMAK